MYERIALTPRSIVYGDRVADAVVKHIPYDAKAPSAHDEDCVFYACLEILSLCIFESCPSIARLTGMTPKMKRAVKAVIRANDFPASLVDRVSVKKMKNVDYGFVMVPYGNGTLRDAIVRHTMTGETFDVAFLLETAFTLCRTLDCLCKAGTRALRDEFRCHMDLKPENIILHGGGVCVIDLSAYSYNGVDSVRNVQGTPLYWSYARFRRPHKADISDELYAIGIILYEMMTGDPFVKPFTTRRMRDKVSAPSGTRMSASQIFHLSKNRYSSEIPRHKFLPDINTVDDEQWRVVKNATYDLLHRRPSHRTQGMQRILYSRYFSGVVGA